MRDSDKDVSVVFETRIWMKGPGRIGIASKEAGFISTVSNDPSSKRFHRKLYEKLERVLRDHGKL